jgi:hypothetical protein
MVTAAEVPIAVEAVGACLHPDGVVDPPSAAHPIALKHNLTLKHASDLLMLLQTTL